MEKHNRIIIVDALRGVALMFIMLLHSVEHFDFFLLPENPVFFSADTDKAILETLKFLFGGKAYAIFALLFGFSFYIQIKKLKEKGKFAEVHFMWRLLILLYIGFFHSLLYRGDILQIYATLGFLLVLFNRFPTKALLVATALLLMQIPIVIQTIQSFVIPDYEYVKTFGSGLGKLAKETYAYGSFSELIEFNLWDGRATNLAWTYYNGRYLQLLALFIIGLILGRVSFFENYRQYKKQLKVLLGVSIVGVIALSFVDIKLQEMDLTKAQSKLCGIIVKSYNDIMMTFAYISAILLMSENRIIKNALTALSNVGKMSLSNYLVQAVVGVTFFYGFGLGMYNYLGATISLMYGVLFFALQLFVSKWWLTRFNYGPVEWLWRSLTFFNFKIPMKKS